MTISRTINDPLPGYYVTRLIKNGPLLPVRVWLEDGPRNPYTGELIGDQTMRMTIGVKGYDPYERWTWMGPTITQAEYRSMMAVYDWAAGTTAPEGQPERAVDLVAAEPIF